MSGDLGDGAIGRVVVEPAARGGCCRGRCAQQQKAREAAHGRLGLAALATALHFGGPRHQPTVL